MNRLLLVAASSLLLLGTGSFAQDPVSVGTFIYESTVEMRKWQNSQSWGKFRSAHYGKPIRIKNFTNAPITFSAEGENCDSTDFTIKSNETTSLSCGSSDGNAWWNLRFPGNSISADEGSVLGFWYDQNGQLDLFDYTAQARAKM